MKLNPYIWLPHLKFTLMTMAVLYPVNPNSVSKKKLDQYFGFDEYTNNYEHMINLFLN